MNLSLQFDTETITDFNPANLAKFREYLKDKYKTLANFNTLFHKKYRKWEEIEPPRKPGNIGSNKSRHGDIALLAEFKLYEDNLLAEVISENSGIVKSVNKEKMCGVNYVHHINYDDPKSLGSILNSDDYSLLAGKNDIDYIGISNHDRGAQTCALLYDGIYAAAKRHNRLAWITEGGTAHQYYAGCPWKLEAKAFRAFFHGVGLQLWFAHEPNKRSCQKQIFNHDNSINEKGKAIGRVATFVRDNCYLLRGAKPVEPEVGLLFLPEASYIAFAESGTLWPHTNFIDIYKFLHLNNIPVRILRKGDLLKKDIQNFKLIIIPGHKYGLGNKYLDAILNYYQKGGNLITTMQFGEYDNHLRKATGPKILEEVFDINFTEKQDKAFVKPLQITNKYGGLEPGTKFYGSKYKPFTLNSSSRNKVVASTGDNQPCIIVHKNKQHGSWLYLGTELPDNVSQKRAWKDLLLSFIEKTGVKKPVLLLNGNRDISMERYALYNPKNNACFVWAVNKGRKPEKVSLCVNAPSMEKGRFYDFIKRKYMPATKKGDSFCTNIEIPGEHSVIIGLLPSQVTPRITQIPSFRLAYQEEKNIRKTSKPEKVKPIASDVEVEISKAVYPSSYSNAFIGTTDKEGFIKDWLILGPFANPKGRKTINVQRIIGRGYDIDYLKPFGGEKKNRIMEGAYVRYSFPNVGRDDLWGTTVSPGQMNNVKVPWKRIRSKKPKIDLLKYLQKPHIFVVSYAFCTIESPHEKDILIRLGSDDGYKLWVNGKMAGEYHERRAAKIDDNTHLVHLKKGINNILLKVDQDSGGYGFYLRITDLNCKPLGGVKIMLK